MSDEAAAEFFVAARRGDAAALRACVARLVPVLEPAVRRTLRRQHALVRRCRVDEDDVVQRAFERLLVAPPDNPGALPPLAVLTAWVRAVAVNHLLDLNRRAGLESLSVDASPDSDDPTPRRAPPPAAMPPAQEAQVDARELWRRACDCADRDLARYKHLRELFYAVADEPELGARELAGRLGLLAAGGGADEEAARRAEQYVWKLRERVHVKLAECLEAGAGRRVPRPHDQGAPSQRGEGSPARRGDDAPARHGEVASRRQGGRVGRATRRGVT